MGLRETFYNLSWYVHICTRMFTATLVTKAKRWKAPKCPSADEQINKMWFI